ncbi:methyltransferase [Rathayibacter caricis DSM 15933]|uniref:Putative 4-hydroxy-4-methyl-2-oxoglutarate aldolase n=1 Tax=Rathayibacter caricis DSM 15933 TaxID=1328867 RepID=A0A2T4URG8_9MICO|nr:methyltransferase [Rathayibacter caricis]PTL72114.1 methyltransferase [Rathayibacter caricis DSM 15933]
MSRIPLITDELIDRARLLPTANIGDAQERFGIASGLHPVWAGARLAGRAFTVWTRPGDNLLIHRALDAAQPGDVIVVNGGGDVTRALIGDLIGLRADTLGIAGFVVDGAVRDAGTLGDVGMPVFARAVSPAGPYKHGPGRLDEPVAISGVVVAPGDLVVGDADGVVVVKASEAESVVAAAEAIERGEAEKRRSILSGAPRALA